MMGAALYIVEIGPTMLETDSGEMLIGSSPRTAGEALNDSSGQAVGRLGLPSLADGIGGGFREDSEDQFIAELPLTLPELDLSSGVDLVTSSDLAQSMLVGGRVRAAVLPQRGSPLSVIAAVIGGDEGRSEGGGQSPLVDLFVSPLRFADTAMLSALLSAGPKAVLTGSVVDEQAAEAPEESGLLVGAIRCLVVAAGGVGAIAWRVRRQAERSEEEEGKGIRLLN